MIQVSTNAVWGGVALPEPVAWYDFSDASTVSTSAGLIFNVTDKSGSGTNTLVQATVGNRPQYAVNTIGGLNTATFDGSFDFLDGEAPNIDSSNGLTIAIVCRNANNIFSGIQRIYMLYDNSPLNAIGVATTTTTARLYQRYPEPTVTSNYSIDMSTATELRQLLHPLS